MTRNTRVRMVAAGLVWWAWGAEARAGDEVVCEPEVTAGLVFDLFPPAPQARREEAARLLAVCGEPRSAGAVAAAMRHDEAEGVRVEAVRALRIVGAGQAGPFVRVLEEEPSVRVRGEAIAALSGLEAWGAVRRVMLDTEENPDLRLTALRALDEAGLVKTQSLERLKAQHTDPVLAALSKIVLRGHVVPMAPVSPEAEREALGDALGGEPEVVIVEPVVVVATEPEPLADRTRLIAPALDRVDLGTVEVGEARPIEEATVPEVVVEKPRDDEGLRLLPPLAPPAPPVDPNGPGTGTRLAIATSTVAGATLFPAMAMLGGQDSTGVLVLVGTAGALIGAVGSWGLTSYLLEPPLSSSAWYTNVTMWGALAGQVVATGSGTESAKLYAGARVAGETLGLVAGLWSASKYDWTVGEAVLANSMLGALAVTDVGFKGLSGAPFGIGPRAAVGIVPGMVAAAIAARWIDPTGPDLGLMAAGSIAAAWTGTLVAGGAFREGPLGGRHAMGGAGFGLGLGYLATLGAAAATDMAPARIWAGSGGLLAGNLLGLGAHMFAAPWSDGFSLGAGIGGAALAAAAFAYAPHHEAKGSTAGLAAYGGAALAGHWALAAALSNPARYTTRNDDTRFLGGTLAGAVTGAVLGGLSARWIDPGFTDGATATLAMELGAGAGLGVARLMTEAQGAVDGVGLLTGAVVGLGAGAAVAAATELRGPDVGAGATGLATGLLAGALLPTISDEAWSGGRGTQGGALTGAALGAAVAMTAAHLQDADRGDVAVPAVAGLLGLGMGAGAGLAWPDDGSRPERIGALVGSLGVAGVAMLADRKLKLSEGLGAGAPRLGIAGLASGAAYGAMLAGTMSPTGEIGRAREEAVVGSVLLGASAGLATGLVVSKSSDPAGTSLATAYAGSGLGMSLGLGVATLASPVAGPGDAAGQLVGALGGLVAGAAVANATELRGADVLAGSLALPFGALLGSLVPSIAETQWDGARGAKGGALVGLSVGSAMAAWSAHALGASAAEVWVPATAGLLGLGAGWGVGHMLPVDDETTRRERIGVVAGTTLATAAGILLDRQLALHDGLGESAWLQGVFGTMTGAYLGSLTAGMLDGSGLVTGAASDRVTAGVVAGASLGLASGLVLSKVTQPDGQDTFATLAAMTSGSLVGRGALRLVEGRAETVGQLGGAVLGLGGGALLAHAGVRFASEDWGAYWAGGAAGAISGAFLPSLADPTFQGTRASQAGSLVGAGLLSVGAAALAHAKEATAAEVWAPTLAATLGGLAGVGLGELVPSGDTRLQRASVVAGVLGVGGLVALTERELGLADALGLEAFGTGLFGGTLGYLLAGPLAAATSTSGTVAGTPESAVSGGKLFATSVGVLGGAVLSRWYDPGFEDVLAITAGWLAGSAIGHGGGLATTDADARSVHVAQVSGAVLGAIGAGLVEHADPLDAAEGFALFPGAAAGAIAGAVLPTLGSPTWDWDRHTQGFTLAGAGLGAIGAAALAKAMDADSGDVALASVGGLDGLVTGLGVTIAAGPQGSQAARIALAAGTLAGSLVGGIGWKNEHLTDNDKDFLLASALATGWAGAWVPALGSGDYGALDRNRQWGGVLAGAGLASLVGSVLAPRLHPGTDLVQNALVFDLLGTGLGLGAGLVANGQDNVTVGSMLAGGVLAAALGAGYHEAIEVTREDVPLVTMAMLEGAWLGAWLPSLLFSDATEGQVGGGVLAGAAGAATVAALANSSWKLSPATSGLAIAGTAIGASIAGGSALVSEGLEGRGSSALVMAGSVAGAYLAGRLGPDIESANHPVGATLAGAAIGALQGLTFAWAGRAGSDEAWGGATLVGTGAGAGLGLAASGANLLRSSHGPAAAGFAAWGAWTGAFAGALVDRDSHDVTLGGMLGANLGFLGGYALVHGKLVSPSDFGWLSAFGAAGTVVGGIGGAVFATKDDPRPVLGGLAIGPVVGMVAGALLLPKLRAWMDGRTGGGGGEVWVPDAEVVVARAGWRVE